MKGYKCPRCGTITEKGVIACCSYINDQAEEKQKQRIIDFYRHLAEYWLKQIYPNGEYIIAWKEQ